MAAIPHVSQRHRNRLRRARIEEDQIASRLISINGKAGETVCPGGAPEKERQMAKLFQTPRAVTIACIYVLGFGLAGFLLVQHWVHVPAMLPFVFLLACPLMHIFMHGGHGRQHRHEKAQADHREG
jgi:hypothetical protein